MSKSPKDTTDRMRWMDLTRGFAILLVVLDHATASVGKFGDGAPIAMQVLDGAFAPFRMPMLMFLSGMLLARSLRKSPGPYIAGKLRSIGWPYLVWSCITLGAMGELSSRKTLEVPFLPPTLLWYLWFLLAYYLIALILVKINFIPWWLVIVASLAVSAIAPDKFRFSRFCFLLAFFGLGHLYATHRASIDEWIGRWWILAISAISAVLVATASGCGWSVRYESIWAWGVVGLIILVVHFTPMIGDGRAPRVAWVGQNSLTFYVVHWPIILVVMSLMKHTRVDNPWILLAIFLTVSVAAGSACVSLRQRWRVVDAAFEFPRRSASYPKRANHEVGKTEPVK